MSVAAYKTFSSGEVLTAADLNASITQIVNNGTDVAFPLTKNVSCGGFTLYFDAANTMGATSGTKGVSLAGMAFNDAKTTVASAATPDIWTACGDLIDYTGTVTATGFAAAPQAGAQRKLLCAGAAVFTADANVLIDGYLSGTNFTATAGDVVDVIAVTTTQFRLKPRLYSGNAVVINNAICDFRLTLTTGVPVTTSDVTAAETLYASPCTGNRIALYDGTNWNVRTSAEFSIDIPDVTGVHDVFCYDNAGVPTLEVLVWTDATTRATALTLQNGVLVKSGATTRRYLGTFYSTTAGNGQVEDSIANRYLWNYYNRRARTMRVIETTSTWTYTSPTRRQANNSTANQLNFVMGYGEDAVTAFACGCATNDSAASIISTSIGLDSATVVATGCIYGGVTTAAVSKEANPSASYTGYSGVGVHALVWQEAGQVGGTTTWYGTNAGIPAISGIHGVVWA